MSFAGGGAAALAILAEAGLLDDPPTKDPWLARMRAVAASIHLAKLEGMDVQEWRVLHKVPQRLWPVEEQEKP